MARFTRAELEAFNGAPVDDLVDRRVRLLFVGINPGLWTAAVDRGFPDSIVLCYDSLIPVR